MNSVLKTTDFWVRYLTFEPGEVTEEVITAQLDGLRPDFAVRQETFSYQHDGREHTGTQRLVDFAFACGDRYSMVVEYEPTIYSCDRTLFLVELASGKRHRMGWWDSARWHPYCLQLSELDTLLKYWEQHDPRWKGSAVPLLLLCQFVGLADDSARDALATQAQLAWESLGLPNYVGTNSDEEEIRLPSEIPLRIPDDSYQWELDDELGWVFMSEEYACYSIRNRPHAGSEEGWFPFAVFREMMTEIKGDPPSNQ